MQTIPALRDVQIYRPGYAIEYDYFDPMQLHHTLETRPVGGLYFAGQINGTTGYEEAAGQGLVAGANAALAVLGREPLVLSRDRAYIGVLIDDLITKGVDEPYRMFTSRAEHRILLRQDDADMRLTPLAFRLGLADEIRMRVLEQKREARDGLVELARTLTVKAGEVEALLASVGSAPLRQSVRLVDLVLRPQLSIPMLAQYIPQLNEYITALPKDGRDEIVEAAEVLLKYEGYVKREQLNVDKLRRLEDIRIAEDYDYSGINALSTEARQKLQKHRPSTIGQASRIPGVSPSDVNVLLLLLGR